MKNCRKEVQAMESWVSERLKIFLPALEGLTLSDELQIAALCEGEIEALRNRGLGSILSYKRPLREMRNAVKALASTGADLNQYDIALKYLELTEAEKLAINQPSEQKRDERLTQQAFIRRPDEVVARIERLLQSNHWAEVAAGLSCATGRRLAEVVRFAVYREKSLYTVLFSGQRKTEHSVEYEIPTLVHAQLVIAAWRRLRLLRDFSDVPSDSISSNFGPVVKSVVNATFADLIEALPGRAELYTHMLRAAYPRLAMFYFLPPRIQEIAYASAILGHVANRDGELVPNYQASLYYMSYKIMGEDGVIDGREGVKLGEPGVEVLEQFKQKGKTAMAETTASAEKRTKIGASFETKDAFDQEQAMMSENEGVKLTADAAVMKLIEDHKIYRQLAALASDVPALVGILQEAAEIKLESETPLDALRAALADKRRFRATYDKRTEANETRDYTAMTMEELSKTRTSQASMERWRRAVDMIEEYNDNAVMDELRWFINASAVKQLVGGRGTEINKYLQTRQSELDEHHKKYSLTPGRNHGRTNIRERVMGESAAPMEDEE